MPGMYPRNHNLFVLLLPYTKNIGVFKCRSGAYDVMKPGWPESPTHPYYDGGKWAGITYTTCAWCVPKGWRGMPYANLPMYQSGPTGDWPIGSGKATNFTNFNYRTLGAPGPADAIVLFCIGGGFMRDYRHPLPQFPNNHVPGRHGPDGLVLFADWHAKTVPWQAVAQL